MTEQDILVGKVLRLSREQAGPMPDAKAYERRLRTLPLQDLRTLAGWIEEDGGGVQQTLKVEFWGQKKRRAMAAPALGAMG